MSDNKAALSAFRKEVAAWMGENVPADPGFLLPLTFLEVGTEQQLDFLREWQYKLWSAGYLGMHWPSEYGGQGADPAYQYIVDKELGKHNAPIIFNTIGLNWVGPMRPICVSWPKYSLVVCTSTCQKNEPGRERPGPRGLGILEISLLKIPGRLPCPVRPCRARSFLLLR